MWLSVSERNVLQGGYRDVNRGSANRIEWNSIMGSVVIRKATNCGRKMKNIIRCDDAANRHGRGKYRNFCSRYPKENFIRKISSHTKTQTQYTVGKWS